MKAESQELVVKQWLDKSAEDLETAQTLLDTGRYAWCAFLCQQALEKCLKAGYVKEKKRIPPYIHKLERLCELLELDPPPEILDSIIEIDKYYIAARYPGFEDNTDVPTKDRCEKVFQRATEAYRWPKQALHLEGL